MENEENRIAGSFEEFLSGASVYLRLPDIEKDILQGVWNTWFNSLDNTKYLVHGVFPISKSGEADLIRNEMGKVNSLLLCIVQRSGHEHIGVVSLKNIDFINRNAEIGIVMGGHRNPGAALEAMALIMKHAFDRLNLSMLYAGQHQDLWKWVNALALIGFRIDGYRREAGVRNGKSYGIFLTSVLASDFYKLESARNGNILTDSVVGLMRTRGKQNPKNEIDESIVQFNDRWRKY